MRVRARLGDIGGNAELDAQDIFAQMHLAGDVDVVADKAIVGAGDDFAVEQDGGDAIDFGEGQRQVAVDIGRRGVEAALDMPFRLAHPHHDLFVLAEIGIGDEIGSEERAVHVARQSDCRRDVARRRGQAIGAAEIKCGVEAGYRQVVLLPAAAGTSGSRKSTTEIDFGGVCSGKRGAFQWAEKGFLLPVASLRMRNLLPEETTAVDLLIC